MRDINFPHPTVKMDGNNPCITCKIAKDIGYCTLHKCEVGAFDGCTKHQLKEKIFNCRWCKKNFKSEFGKFCDHCGRFQDS